MNSNILVYLVVCTCLVGVSGLRCYSCYGSGGVECANSDQYIRARNGDGDPSLLKTCSPPFDVICYKEVYMPNGTVASHIRDCGDGKTFTFSAMTGFDYSNLTNHPVDNKTVCAGDPAHTFCLSKCDTDFCNGPDPNTATKVVFSFQRIVLMLSVGLLVKEYQRSR